MGRRHGFLIPRVRVSHDARARIARIRGDEFAAGEEIEQARRIYSEMGATLQVARLTNEWNR